MTRRYHEAVEVQSRRGGAVGRDTTHGDVGAVCGGAPAPTAFLWRGRLYVVREVLDHWHERAAWWRDALDPSASVVPGPVSVVPGPHRLEREVWRVVASAGRHRGSGVYDLAGGGAGRAWHLVRVAD